MSTLWHVSWNNWTTPYLRVFYIPRKQRFDLYNVIVGLRLECGPFLFGVDIHE